MSSKSSSLRTKYAMIGQPETGKTFKEIKMAHGHGGRRPGAGRKPGRVSKAKKHIAEQAATYGPAALQVLLDIAQDPDAPASSRVSAANAILDRGYGRPTAPPDFEPEEDRIGEILREIQERGSRLPVSMG